MYWSFLLGACSLRHRHTTVPCFGSHLVSLIMCCQIFFADDLSFAPVASNPEPQWSDILISSFQRTSQVSEPEIQSAARSASSRRPCERAEGAQLDRKWCA